MPTTNYRSNTGELISDALFLIEALEEEEPMSGEQEQQGMRALSRLIASWQAQSEHVWTVTQGGLVLTGEQSYLLGRNNSPAFSGSLRGTFTAPIQPSPALNQIQTFSVAPLGVSDFPVGTTIVITAQDATLEPHTTTVQSVFGDTITLTAAVPFSHEGGVLYYGDDLSLARRPFRIMNVRRSTTADGVQVPVERVSRGTYMDNPNKSASGQPVQFYYDRQLEHGELFVWPAGTGFLFFDYERELLKPTALADVLDFPEEWFDAIIYNLAHRLAPMYATNPIKRQLIKAEAMELKHDILSEDSDDMYMAIG